jgi:hypothetical protein
MAHGQQHATPLPFATYKEWEQLDVASLVRLYLSASAIVGTGLLNPPRLEIVPGCAPAHPLHVQCAAHVRLRKHFNQAPDGFAQLPFPVVGGAR